MRPTTSKKTIIVELALLAAITVFFIASIQRGMQSTDGFVAPVYGSDGNEPFITHPFFLEEAVGVTGLSSEQVQKVADFRRHILKRISSSVALKETEKIIILGSISTEAVQGSAGKLIVDQRLLQFTEGELSLIRAALQK